MSWLIKCYFGQSKFWLRGFLFWWFDGLFESVPILALIEVVVKDSFVIDKFWFDEEFFFGLAWTKSGGKIFGVNQDWGVQSELFIKISGNGSGNNIFAGGGVESQELILQPDGCDWS